MNSPLVTSQWLAEHLAQDSLILLDASMDKVVGKPALIYDQPLCIPGALRFDLEKKFFDFNSEQLHALPTQAQFEQGLNELGITAEHCVVIYDNQGIYSAPRAWWTFKVMGFENVYVLDGGLPQWREEQRATAAHHQQPAAISQDGFSRVIPARRCNSTAVMRQLQAQTAVVIDARSHARFTGQADEPRPGVRRGHIPNSVNLPFTDVLNGHKYQPTETLKRLFQPFDISANTPLIFSCGSGITACIILLAAQCIGYHTLTLYDGSWADWGGDHQLAVELG